MSEPTREAIDMRPKEATHQAVRYDGDEFPMAFLDPGESVRRQVAASSALYVDQPKHDICVSLNRDDFLIRNLGNGKLFSSASWKVAMRYERMDGSPVCEEGDE